MFSRPVRALAAGAVALGLVALAGCGSSAADATTGADDSAWPDPFIVATIPSEDKTDLDPSDSAAMTLLEDELGLNIEYHVAQSYAATIEAQRAGRAHMAEYGPFSYVLAADSGVDLQPIATYAADPNAQSGYHSVASVLADSDIESLEDAAGRTVCFVDPGSTSGYLFPSAGLIEAGLDPETDVQPVFAGGHDASVLAMLDGQCEIAFSTEGMATEQLLETGQMEEGQARQIWTSELIPSSPIAVTGTVPQDLIDAIAEVYTEKLNRDWVEGTEYQALFEEVYGPDEEGASWGFIPVDDSVYDGVRAVCEATQSEACAATE